MAADGDGWWRSAVVYQVYPRSFADSDGDGVGDLQGVIRRLDHLVLLGVDVLWLSPVYRSPQDDNGYDISDYQDIDPVFGTLGDLDDLIVAGHRRGIRLVMDLVVNHTSDEHPWFVQSRSGTASPMRDWYIWRPARSGCSPGAAGAEPNDWTSYFSGSAWEFEPTTGEYYLHQFSRKQPDLNWENPQVRASIYSMMRWWLERGVDGFRMDVVNLISKDAAFPDGQMFSQVANRARVHDFLQEMHREVLAGRNLITVGETPGATVADGRLYTDPARAELDMVFTFEHVDLDIAPGGTKWDLAPLRVPDLKATLGRWQSGLLDAGWNSLYWNNHDQPRVVSRWGDDAEHRVASAKAFATVLHLLRGTPYIYQGEEIGMTNAHFTALEQYRDIESLRYARTAAAAGVDPSSVLRSLAAKSRDNARTPMQWDATPNAGFTTGAPWIAVNDNYPQINVAAATSDQESVFHHYRHLIALRHRLPVVVDGDVEMLWPEDEQIFGYVRRLGGTALLVMANLSPSRATVPQDPRLEQFATAPAVLGDRGPADGRQLGPWQSLAVLVVAGPA